jgi:hypothetical protein
LRRSVSEGRPMSLPNCRRLLHRCLADVGAGVGDRHRTERALCAIYLRFQPFRSETRHALRRVRL